MLTIFDTSWWRDGLKRAATIAVKISKHAELSLGIMTTMSDFEYIEDVDIKALAVMSMMDSLGEQATHKNRSRRDSHSEKCPIVVVTKGKKAKVGKKK